LASKSYYGPGAGSSAARKSVRRLGAAKRAAAALRAAPMQSSAPVVVLYSTTTPALAKVKADIARIKRILDNKRVAYEEVRACRGLRWLRMGVATQQHVVLFPTPCHALAPPRAACMALPQRAACTGRATYSAQVDLASAPGRRAEMLAGSDDLKTIPQLHVNGRVSVSAGGGGGATRCPP